MNSQVNAGGLRDLNGEFYNAVLSTLPLLTSPDNATRSGAESNLTDALNSDPSSFIYSLIQVSLNTSLGVPVRQSALLFIKRIIPMYWSAAFDSFRGPVCFNQEVKGIVRSSLLSIIGDPVSKIRSSATYAIVQISAVDLPDEWPDLLQILSNNTFSDDKFTVIGSFSVLHEIFDDVITDEQFFNGGVSLNVFETCNALLSNSHLSNDVRIEALKLMKSAIVLLTNSNFNTNSSEIEDLIHKVINLLVNLLLTINSNELLFSTLSNWGIIELVCDILDLLANSFYNLFKQTELIELLIQILSKQEPIYNKHSIEEVPLSEIFNDLEIVHSLVNDPTSFLINSISREVELLQSLIEINSQELPNLIPSIIDLLIKLNYLPNEKHQDYIADFNDFVTDETDLSIDANVRTTFMEFFRQLNINHTTTLTSLLIDQIMKSHHDFHARIESMLFILQTILDSDDGLLNEISFEPLSLLELFIGCINDRVENLNHESQILISRLIIILPKLIFTFSSKLERYGLETLMTIVNSIEKFPLDDSFNVIRASILISFQYFNHFMRAKTFNLEIQNRMIYLFNNLMEMANEDTLIMLLESMTIIISIDNKSISSNTNLFTKIIQIGFENCSNFTITSSVLECITDYLKDLEMPEFLGLISNNFQVLFSPLDDMSNEFKPEIDFALQLLDSIVIVNEIPKDLFELVFNSTTKLILHWDDDQVLQSSTQLLISICNRSIENVSGVENGPETLLKIVSKLLDPQMSDRAIFKLGDLISFILNNFSDKFHVYLADIMNGLTIRLSQAKEVPTIENLILIFNKLTINQPKETIDFLFNFQIDNSPSILKIFPIWFNAFEVMRGYDSIYSNVCAFIKIYQLNDNRLHELLVNGDEIPMDVPKDLIITRSMAKKFKLQYFQIPSDAKIIKLLINELKNEVHSMSNENNTAHAHGEGDEEEVEADDNDEGWEEFDEDLYSKGVDFNQLKQFIHPDGELKRESGDNSIFEILVQFFKFEAAEGHEGFQKIFNGVLNDNERKLLMEYLAFT